MPRVLLTGFCAVPGPRRAGVQLRHVIRALAPTYSIDLLVVREGEQAYVERQGAVRVLRVPTHDADLRGQVQAFQRALKRQLDGADYDVVHCRDAWSALPVIEARARIGYAVVYDLARSPLGESTYDAELDAQYGRDEEAALLAADLILAPTPAAVKALQRRGRPERVLLSPPGVDVDRFDWDDPPRNGPARIVYAGSIDPGRGLRVLVRAMASIVREIDARLVLVGPTLPKFEQSLKDGVRELGLVDKVELVGPIDHDEVPALLASATVCVAAAGSDLTPSPSVVFPTKLLEYMAVRRAIVAPKRDTVAMVVENNREALLFEPGDPVDLARKVLRLLGEPALRQRVAQNGYERVRRDFTASAARRYLRAAYDVLASRFALAHTPAPTREESKMDLLADDDYEATVFEEAPVAPHVDTAISRIGADPLDAAIASLEDHTSSEQVVAPPGPHEETVEREAAPRLGTATALTTSLPTRVRAPTDDWVVTNVAEAIARGESLDDGRGHHEDGTPVEGLVAAAPPLPQTENLFVAGEIDVPTPSPEGITPPVELAAASADPDTGSRTPPIERR
jgi:glycosyltransferase involved in cell wall biosynthesis